MTDILFLHRFQLARYDFDARMNPVWVNVQELSSIEAAVGTDGKTSIIRLRNGTAFEVNLTQQAVVKEIKAAWSKFT